MKKSIIMAILLGSALCGAQNTKSSMSYMEKTAATLIGSGIAYIASTIAGAPDSFKNSLLMTGLTLPLPWIGRHMKVDETAVNLSGLIPMLLYLISSGKSLFDIIKQGSNILDAKKSLDDDFQKLHKIIEKKDIRSIQNIPKIVSEKTEVFEKKLEVINNEVKETFKKFLGRSAGFVMALAAEIVGVTLYGFAKAYFTQSCAQ